MYKVCLFFLGTVAAHSWTFYIQFEIKQLFADLRSKDTTPHHRYWCTNQYYQGIIFSKFVDVGSHYGLPVWCNGLSSNKRFLAAFVTFLLTPRLLMAIGMIPLYHTDTMDKTTFQSAVQF